MATSFRRNGEVPCHQAAEAEKLLKDPNFLSDCEVKTPELHFTSAHDFRFSSPMVSPWVENNDVFGKLFRAGPDWQKQPSVILLHGWNADLQYRYHFPRLARKLARAGVNTALFQLPYHGWRRPRQPGAIQDFLSGDLLHMVQATRQALADTRAIIAWLTAQGSPAVGLWGTSLGAWLAGLLICGRKSTEIPQAAPSFAVLLTPVSNLDQAIQELAFCEPIRHSLQKAPSIRLDRLNLASHVPYISRENILLIAGQHDLFAPVETIEMLWRTWGQPALWRFPHGHISILLSPLIMNRVRKWIQNISLGLRHTPH